MDKSKKIDIALECDLQCKYCRLHDRCTGGTSLGPNGPVFPACVDGDYAELFDERAFDNSPLIQSYNLGYINAIQELVDRMRESTKSTKLIEMVYPHGKSIKLQHIIDTASKMIEDLVN